jgi:hypothetical protein
MEDMVREEKVELQAFLTSTLEGMRHQLHYAAVFSPVGSHSRFISCVPTAMYMATASPYLFIVLSCHRQ